MGLCSSEWLPVSTAGSQLQIYTPPSSQAPLGSGALLKCRFSIGEQIDLSSLRVQWYFSGRRILEYPPGQGDPQPGASISEQELRNGNASLSLARVTPFDQGPYKCVVGYGVEELQSETTLSVAAAPRISIPRRSARKDTESFFLCHVWGFYPGDVTVTWLRDGRVLTDATRSAPQRNPDGTFNLTLTYTFTPTASDSGSNFSCHVTHAALAQPLQEEFPLDVTAAPRLSIPQRSAGTDTATSFPCHVWGFYPQDIAVTWLRDGRVLTDATRSAPQRNPDGTFNLTLTYTFTPTVSDSGSIFSCHVSHAALAQPLREEFPLDVTEAHGSTTALTAVLGISVTLAMVTTALATYFWCRWKGRCAPTSTDGKVPYSDSEVPDGKVSKSVSEVLVPGDAMEGTFPEDTAVTWERIHGQDRTLIGTDGVTPALESDTGEITDLPHG
ncbi:natural cytotoxicity triggering receptor 3 ligand 1-like [Malaclemys terrapin pileata]|uniref:natural cytotoxicity triggering receptor 3 ligand 1-like n=1 Tax=Malaclemys terrapin pileata TaxID=2991368 RepID=UPI0023A8FF64|nr:natural cytotoxicity triggering receptor 3 ligand 1-like [Malaclemys terrapin pileata]